MIREFVVRLFYGTVRSYTHEVSAMWLLKAQLESKAKNLERDKDVQMQNLVDHGEVMVFHLVDP